MEYAEQQHINNLMINMPAGSDSLDSTIFESKYNKSITNKTLVGGSKADEPFGGFPPIYQCTEIERKNKKETDEPRKRATSFKTGVTLKEILSKRKGTVPLFEFGNSESSDSNVTYMGDNSESPKSEYIIEKVKVDYDMFKKK